jgi:phospholipid/cholesterol/gamma-HCH transport system substrate-binding protein
LEAKANYKFVGLITIILLASLIIVSLWLSFGFDKKRYKTYLVYMAEAVSGLNDDSQVKFNGVKVGYISGIEINKKDPQQVKLYLKIEEGTPITVSTQASLISQGITGNNFLGLSAMTPNTELLKAMPGEKYPVITYKSSFFKQLETTIEDVSKGMKELISEKNTKNLSETISNLTEFSQVFAKNSKELDKVLHEFPLLMSELRESVAKFSDMSMDVSNASDNFSSTMLAGRNAIDKLNQQALPPTISLLRRLDVIAANIEELSVELRNNPSIIVRGAPSRRPGPGE